MNTSSKTKRADKVIRTKCANPHRQGTDAFRAFEAMEGGVTIGEYLSRFEGDKNKAARWLTNEIKGGYVEVLG